MPYRASALLLVLALVSSGCRSRRNEAVTEPEPPSAEEQLRTRLTQETLPFLEKRPEPTGKVHEFEIVAAPTSLTLLDGRSLDVWTYNGQVPGPTLRVRVGDTVRATLKNELPQPTTIHWHGVRLPNAMDGVPHVTQPPVQPGESFVYEFVARDAGTFWFHPHVRSSEQVERGLYGVLIVEPPEPVAEREVIWVLDDWLLDESGQLDPRFVTRRDLAHDGRWGNVLTVNGYLRPELELPAGERIRLRILNVANGRVFALDLSPLGGEVVAFDGLGVRKLLDTNRIELAPGNRVDLDVRLPTSKVGETLAIVDRVTRRENLLATVRIESPSDDAREASKRVEKTPRGFVPHWSQAFEMPVDETFSLNARRGGPHGLEWMINDRVMRHDEGEPGQPEHHEVPYRFRQNRFVKLRFVNDSPRLHPMHLHGVFFKVIARNGQPIDEGHWRDTVLIQPRETVDIGMVPTELGDWMLHCHILEHADSGMMTLFSVSQ